MRAFCHYLHCLSMPKKDPYYHNFGTYRWIHKTKLGDMFHIPVTDRLNKRRQCVHKTIGRSGTLFCHFLLILVRWHWILLAGWCWCWLRFERCCALLRACCIAAAAAVAAAAGRRRGRLAAKVRWQAMEAIAQSLRSSRIDATAGGEDVHELMHRRGWSDGLPLVPPTPVRVAAILQGTARAPSEVLGTCPPANGTVTVEKAAIAAVMAGCEPKHFRVVLAGVEAMLDPAFNVHGNSSTTMGATPALVVSGAARDEAGLNYQHGALGSGTRANAAIGCAAAAATCCVARSSFALCLPSRCGTGWLPLLLGWWLAGGRRALKLLLQNVGGARIGGTESTTLGTPMKFTMCLAEWEERAPSWESYGRTQGYEAGQSVVTLLPVVGGPHQLVDFATRDAHELCGLLAETMSTALSPSMPVCPVVVGPQRLNVLTGSPLCPSLGGVC
jgi:hypothetical protein